MERRREGESGTEKAINKLLATGILPKKPSAKVKAHIHSRLNLARNWIRDCAPPHLHINIPEKTPTSVLKETSPEMQKIVLALATTLETTSWKQEEIKTCMMELRTQFKLSRKQMNVFFGILYQIFLGSSRGPRFAPFIAALDQEWVINRLKSIQNKTEDEKS